MNSEPDLQRSLGRIEGLFEQIDKKLDTLEIAFNTHKHENQSDFSDVRKLVYNERDALRTELQAFHTARAVLVGQLSLGQKTLAFVGAAVGFLAVVVELWKAVHPKG